MIKRIVEALHALLSDVAVFDRLLEQMKDWGATQEDARKRLISTLSNIVQAFEKSHAIVLLELSQLTNSSDAADYRNRIDELDQNKLYELFKAKDVCEHLHVLQSELASGFGDIKDSIVLGAAKRLKRALGELEEFEYALAYKYEDYLRKTLMQARDVNTTEDLNDAVSAIIDTEEELINELRELTKFKRSILSASLYT